MNPFSMFSSVCSEMMSSTAHIWRNASTDFFCFLSFISFAFSICALKNSFEGCLSTICWAYCHIRIEGVCTYLAHVHDVAKVFVPFVLPLSSSDGEDIVLYRDFAAAVSRSPCGEYGSLEQQFVGVAQTVDCLEVCWVWKFRLWFHWERRVVVFWMFWCDLDCFS